MGEIAHGDDGLLTIRQSMNMFEACFMIFEKMLISAETVC